MSDQAKIDHTDQDMESIGNALNIAKEYGLEAEVFLSAFRCIQGNPTMKIGEALHHGLCEWDL